jgi:hypothetical protein
MEKKMNEIIKDIDSEKFKNELLEKIFETGYGTLSKTDLYDYIIYTASRNSKLNFLDTQSNYKNAMLLKVSETKVKNMKLNISLKYKTPEEQNSTMIIFLKRIGNSEIRIKDQKDKFEFYLEDTFFRMQFENELKTKEGITFEYKQNKEIVEIEKKYMLSIIKQISKESDADFLEKFGKELKTKEAKERINTGAISFLEKVKDITVDFGVDILSEIIKKTIFPNGI